MSFNNDKMPPIRAFCATLIILGHFSYFGISELSFLRILAPICVSLFLFISGYGLMISFQNKGSSYLHAFLGKKLLKISFPAIIVTLLHIFLCRKSDCVGVLERVHIIFTKGSTLLPHYWFVWAILFDYLVFWLSCKFVVKKWQKWAILLCIIAFMSASCLAGFDRCWWVCSLAFPAGLFFAEYDSFIFSFCSKRIVNYYIVLALCGLVFIGCFFSRNQYIWTLCYVFIPITAALIVSRLPLDNYKLPVLSFLGAISYELFLIHVTVMSFLRGNLIYISSNLLFVVAVLIFTIGIGYGIHVLCMTITQKANF